MYTIKLMFISILIMVMLVGGFNFVSDLVIIDHYEQECRSAIINSISDSFGVLSLENISDRVDLSNLQERNINIDSIEAKNRFIESIKSNLKLDESLTPLEASFIINREAVKIKTLQVISSSMIPYDYNGITIKEESMIVEMDLPIELSFAKDSKWIKISEVVSLETFLTAKER